MGSVDLSLLAFVDIDIKFITNYLKSASHYSFCEVIFTVNDIETLLGHGCVSPILEGVVYFCDIISVLSFI